MNARPPLELAQALQPALNAGSILDRCTLHAWVVTVGYRVGGQYQESRQILQATLLDMPDATLLMPEGAEFARADLRTRYRPQYRAYRMWRKARACGKTAEQLVPWIDFDPTAIDDAVDRWARPVGHYCGD